MPQTTEYLLGQLIESVAGLRRDITELRGDFDEEKGHAHESRKDVHRKIDDLTDRVGKAETTIQIAGQVTAQTRNLIDVLDSTVTKDVKPTVEEFKKIKTMGHGVIVATGVAGGALGLTAAWWGEQFLNLARHLLRIQ